MATDPIIYKPAPPPQMAGGEKVYLDRELKKVQMTSDSLVTVVTELLADLATKSAVGHTHPTSDVTGLDAALADRVNLTTNQTIAGQKTFSAALFFGNNFLLSDIDTSSTTTRGLRTYIDADGPVLTAQARSAAAATLSVLRVFYGSTNSFRVQANGNVQNTNNSYGAISDARLKKDIAPSSDQLEDLRKVGIVKYHLRDDAEDDPLQIGVLAQDLAKVKPGLVEKNPDTGMLSVKYSVFVPILIKAVQELADQVDHLNEQINRLTSGPQ